MWIEITDGPTPLWIKDDDCCLLNGQPAFSYEIPPVPSLPAWFEAPKDSQLRLSNTFPGFPLFEIRSMPSSAETITAFYRECVRRGGLVIRSNAEPEHEDTSAVSRHVSMGFSAENNEHHFRLDVYEYAGIAHWTIQQSWKGSEKRHSGKLQLKYIGQDQEQVRLFNPRVNEEYRTSVNSLRETEPPVERRESPREESILWSSLPDWAQFTFEAGSRGKKYISRDESSRETWNATIFGGFESCPRCMFERCLDSLDAFGFDPTGASHPHRNYYVSILQWGRSLNIHASSKGEGEADLTVLNTLGHLTRFARYTPVSDLSG